MKNLSLIFIAIFTLFFALIPSCNSESNKVVETENETAKCLIGKWVKEIEDQTLVTYEFTPDFHFTAEGINNRDKTKKLDGYWEVKDVGYIRAISGERVFRFKMINCNRLVLKGKTVYIKK